MWANNSYRVSVAFSRGPAQSHSNPFVGYALGVSYADSLDSGMDGYREVRCGSTQLFDILN